MESPSNCIICDRGGVQDAWNDMKVLVCPSCDLAWRASFDIAGDYYLGLNAGRPEPGEEKATSRLHNAQDRLGSIKKFLPKENICDVGCGDGSFLSVLANAGYKNCWGIEPSAYYCKIARGKGLEVVSGDIPEILKRRANAVTLFHVIEHLSDPASALRTIASALEPGAIFVLETPDGGVLVYDEHLFYWNERSLRAIIERMGFKILLITHRSFDWRNAPIRTSLHRLGILRKESSNVTKSSDSEESFVKPQLDNIVRRLVRKTLAHLVHLLGRDDYLLVVAQRV